MTDHIPPGSGPGRGVPAPPPGFDPSGCSPELRRALGSYALGALDPVESDQVRRHLVDCPACRAEYREMAAMPALLSRIPQIEMSVGAAPAVPGPDMFTRLLDRAAAYEGAAEGAARAAAGSASAFAGSAAGQQHQHQAGAAVAHRRRRAASTSGVSGFTARMIGRWRQGSALQRVSIATAGTAVVAAAAIGAYAATSSPAPAFAKTLSATNAATGISGVVDYHSVDWGSWVQLTMKGVPPGDDCSLIAVDAQGERATASTWTAPAGGTATIPGGLAMNASSIVEFEVVTTSGSTLLAIPVH